MTHMQVTALSNSSLDRYPNNTLTSFVHRLPAPIHFDLNQSHTIELRSIGISNKLKESAIKTGVIKIHLQEIDSRFPVHESDSQCLARVAFRGSRGRNSRKNSLFWYEFNHPLAVELNEINTLHELSFKITDSENNPLQLESGPPTVLNLLISEMKFRDHFTITCNPNYTKNIYTNNVSNDFRMCFPNSIELDENWEAALHSVCVPGSLQIETHFTLEFVNHSDPDNILSFTHEWNVTPGEVESVLQNVILTLSIYDLDITIDPHSVSKRVTLLEKDAQNLPVRGKIYMSSSLCRMFKIAENVVRRGGLEIDFTPGTRFEFSTDFSFDSDQHLAIYCDLLKDSIVGNQMCPLLYVLSARKLGLLQGKNDTIYYAPHLTFHSLGKLSFSSLAFQFCTLRGDKVNISSAEGDGISITLLFRHKEPVK